MNNTKRNAGIELLRIVCMLMILILHYCSKGGFISMQLFESELSEISWVIRAFSIIAVNCFILITGYFSIKSKCDYKKILKIWKQTIFYSVTMFLIFKVFFNANLSIKETLQYFFPIMLKTYWFISIYIILYLLAPYINKCINNIDKKLFKRLLIILLIITCVSSILNGFKFETIDKSNGYGILWFITLYCIGAYIQLYGKEEYNSSICLVKYILISLVIYCSRILLWYLAQKGIFSCDINYDMFYAYNSILVTISSIYFFLFFKNIKIKFLETFILKIAPLTLAVYIIHETPIIRNILYANILHTNNINSVKEFALSLPVSCFAIFTICCCVEFMRVKLFKLILYIKNKIMTQES